MRRECRRGRGREEAGPGREKTGGPAHCVEARAPASKGVVLFGLKDQSKAPSGPVRPPKDTSFARLGRTSYVGEASLGFVHKKTRMGRVGARREKAGPEQEGGVISRGPATHYYEADLLGFRHEEGPEPRRTPARKTANSLDARAPTDRSPPLAGAVLSEDFLGRQQGPQALRTLQNVHLFPPCRIGLQTTDSLYAPRT